MSTKTAAVKKNVKKQPEEKVNNEAETDFDIDTVTFEDLKTKIHNDEDYDKIFSKLNENFTTLGAAKTKLQADLLVLAGKQQKAVDLMKSIHKEFKDTTGSEDQTDNQDEETNDANDNADNNEEETAAGEEATQPEENADEDPKPEVQKKKAPVKKSAPAKAPVKKTAPVKKATIKKAPVKKK